jgi:hypothetical protein
MEGKRLKVERESVGGSGGGGGGGGGPVDEIAERLRRRESQTILDTVQLPFMAAAYRAYTNKPDIMSSSFIPGQEKLPLLRDVRFNQWRPTVASESDERGKMAADALYLGLVTKFLPSAQVLPHRILGIIPEDRDHPYRRPSRPYYMAPTMALWYSPETDQYGLFYLVGERLWSLPVGSPEPPRQVTTVRHSIPNILSVYRGSHILHFETVHSEMDARNLRITNVATGVVEQLNVPDGVVTVEEALYEIQSFTLVHPTLVVAFSVKLDEYRNRWLAMHAFSTRRGRTSYRVWMLLESVTLDLYDRYEMPVVQRMINDTVTVFDDDGLVVDIRFENLARYAQGGSLDDLQISVKTVLNETVQTGLYSGYDDKVVIQTARRINAREVYMWLNGHDDRDADGVLDTSLNTFVVQGIPKLYDVLHNVAVDSNVRLIRFERASRAPAPERPITLGSRARRSRRSRRTRRTKRSRRSRSARTRRSRRSRSARTRRSRRSRTRKHR